MPRLLPRLLQKVAYQSLQAQENHVDLKFFRRRPRRKSHKPLPPAPSFSPINRVQSILLDDVNPIINSKAYVLHKALSPRVRTVTSKEDDNRQMTPEEREWWASPYLRMLSSPLRKCLLTERYLPTDFLIRLAPMRLPAPRVAGEGQSLLPDGLEHRRFKNRKSGAGHHILCWKAALQQFSERGMYKRLAPNLSMHTLLSQQIGHLLRARVLQELEILADQAQTQPQSSKDAPVLRRLTRTEFKAIKATGVIPYHNGVAVLIVPPLNRNSVTKQRPEPHSGLSPPDDREPTESTRHRDLPPLSALHPVEGVSPGFPDNLPNLLPESQIPLYNGVALFPSRSQRAALYSRLNHLLLVERRARYRPSPNRPNDREEEGKNAVKIQGDEKASHAFLLCSDATTASRGDVAALAIALWRIRMWEGFGWWEGVNQGWMGRQLQT